MQQSFLHKTDTGFLYGMWAIARPMTKGWGSGAVWKRICKNLEIPDVAFGKTDGIPDMVLAIDKNTGYQWANLPFLNNQFQFGYWDPPYDKLYKKECLEIWRVCRKLAILHTHVYPTSWFETGKRIAGIGVTMGPLKQVRLLQIFRRQYNEEPM